MPMDEPDETAVLRGRMADELAAAAPLSVATLAALRAVPRHRFVPEVPVERAYANEAVVTVRDAEGRPLSSASQPGLVAHMLDQLDVRSGMHVLEIGAGTGYNAALLAELVGPSGHVTTVEIDADLARAAREHLEAAGYGADRVDVARGDGALGWPDGAPYERIELTAGAWDVWPAWFEQLAEGGRLVLPLAFGGLQLCVALERRGGRLVSTSLECCFFIRLRGPLAGPEVRVRLPGVSLLAEAPAPDAGHVAALLAGPARVRELVRERPQVAPYAIACGGSGATVLEHHAMHPLLGVMAIGVVSDDGASGCWLSVAGARVDALPLVEYGTGKAGDEVERRLEAWRARGAPPLSEWRMTFYPKGEAPADARARVVEKEHWTVLVEMGA